jgi:hypothetical protein
MTNIRKDKKMTNREFYENIMNGVINEEVIAKAKENLEGLDRRNANRKVSKSALAKKAENEKFAEKVYEYLKENDVKTASEVGEKFGVSTQKASAILKILENSEKVKVVDVIHKKRIVKGYAV